MDLHVLTEDLAVCRLPATSHWPLPTTEAGFWSVTRTNDELSVVCPAETAPAGDDVQVESDWRALQVAGPLDFSMVGVMAGLTAPLAEVGISVFVISTFDTDYILVKKSALADAVDVLQSAGHTVDCP